jgi:HK97 family phage major capsid protein
MAMTVAEARKEIKKNLELADLIEKKYEGVEITNNEDFNEVKRLLTEVDVLEEKLAALEDREARQRRILEGIERYNTPAPGAARPGMQADEQSEGMRVSPGDQFIKSLEYRNNLVNGAFNSHLNVVTFHVNLKDGTSLIQWKDLLRGGSATSGGAHVQNDRQPGYWNILHRDIVMMDLIPRIQTASDTIEYVYQTTTPTAAAFVAEATATTGTTGRKPESAIAFAVATAPVRTMAHWIPVTNRMLADAPQIRGIVNGELLMGLDLKLEDQILTGNGSGENFTGFLSNTDVNVQGKGTDNELDAIFKGRTKARVVGRGKPNAVIMHPYDWESIRLARQNVATATKGDYLMGPPSQVGAVTVWGIPVIESDAITENTALVGDFLMGCRLYDREQGAIRTGTINDQFVRNMQTILAELRSAFVIHRPGMFTKITGI